MATPGFVAEFGQTSWLRAWAASLGILVAFAAAPSVEIDAPVLRSLVIVFGALAALVMSFSALRQARRSGVAEAAVPAAVVVSMALMGIAHGIVVWRNGSGAASASTAPAQVLVPVASLVLVLGISPSTRLGNELALRWHALTRMHVEFVCVVAAVLVIVGDAVSAESSLGLAALVLAIATLVPAAVVSADRAALATRLDSAPLLRIAIGISLIGAASVAWLLVGPSELTTLIGDLLLVGGLLLAAAGASAGAVRHGAMARLLDPIEVETPGRTIELALDPVLQRCAANLDAGDARIREHVIRTTRLSVTVARELDLEPDVIRRVGLVASLHDVGKTDRDRELLERREQLTHAEVAVVMGHTERGADLVAASPVLAEAAAGVRSHHERLDGHGCPDGLVGDAVPIEARILAVCDAYDAMASSHRFRRGAPRSQLLAILREHGGTQWDGDVVGALSRVIRRYPDMAPAGTISPPGPECLDDLCCPDALPGAIIPVPPTMGQPDSEDSEHRSISR